MFVNHRTYFCLFSKELPSTPVFYDTNGTVINNFTAPHRIKSELKVKCEVVGGNFSAVKTCLFNILPISFDRYIFGNSSMNIETIFLLFNYIISLFNI